MACDTSRVSDREEMRKVFELINRPNVDNFTVLGIGRDADDDEVRRAYLAIAKVYNPHVKRDLELQPMALAIFLRVTKAYKALSDRANRKAYLEQLEIESAARQA
jgi:DnaJ-class molecular chaperone